MSAAAPDPEQRARALLAAHPDGQALATAAFQPIAGGALNRCWRADTPRGPCFVRLADARARRLGADWESEAVLLGIGGEAGVAPRPLLCIPAAGLLVSELLPGSVLTKREARAPARLESLGRLLRAVHGLPPSPEIRRLDFEVQAQSLEAQLDSAAGTRFRARSVAVFERIAGGRGPLVPCHNDIHAANLLETGARLVLVDWEYGGLGDPAFDLAGVASHLSLDAAQLAQVLYAYGSKAEAMRLSDACWAYDYVQWLWYRVAAQVVGLAEARMFMETARAIERGLERPRDIYRS